MTTDLPGAGGGGPSVQEVEWGDVSTHLVFINVHYLFRLVVLKPQ